MHRNHAKDGVACISVSVDPKDKQSAALKFLKAKKAAFANYLLDDEKWPDRLDVGAPPAVFVYDRQGKLVKKFDYSDPDHQFTYDDVEKQVQELLRR